MVNSRQESRAVPSDRQMKPKEARGPPNLSSASKPTSMDYRKQNGSNNVTGPGRSQMSRPQMQKNLQHKTPSNSLEKRTIPSSAKKPVSVMHKSQQLKSQQSTPKQILDRRRDVQESVKGRPTSRQPVSKPQA